MRLDLLRAEMWVWLSPQMLQDYFRLNIKLYSCRYRNTSEVHISADTCLLTVKADTTESCPNMGITVNMPHLAGSIATTSFLQTPNLRDKTSINKHY
jgi:hypothetical protein